MLKKDRFLASLRSGLRLKVELKQPRTFEEAVEFANNKEWKVKRLSQLGFKIEPNIEVKVVEQPRILTKEPGHDQHVAHDVDTFRKEMQEVVGFMKNLSVHMMGGGRGQGYGYGRSYGSNEGFAVGLTEGWRETIFFVKAFLFEVAGRGFLAALDDLRLSAMDPGLLKGGRASLHLGRGDLPRHDGPTARAGYHPLPADATPTLFVEGIPIECTRREVAHIFRPLRGFKEVRIVQKESKRSGGELFVLCFAEFEDSYSAAKALDSLQGYKLDDLDRGSEPLRLQFARVSLHKCRASKVLIIALPYLDHTDYLDVFLHARFLNAEALHLEVAEEECMPVDEDI
ncbi:hypothetical protein L7F22_021040 [Adiantum nelumboides]|nr:hypothetical protein [Adiantum nelumboides]